MRFRKIITFIVMTMLGVLIFGCSATTDTPVLQAPKVGMENITSFPLVGVSDWNSDGRPIEGMGTMGLFNLTIDPIKVSADLTPVRKGSTMDVLEVVDITNFLSLMPCVDCVRIRSVAVDDDGYTILSIGIRHPFKAGDPSKPITAKNRADLHVFNVEGIVISNDEEVIKFQNLGQKIASIYLVNADGYTDYLDMSLDDFYPTKATLHPYILHFDDYSKGNFSKDNPMGFASVTTPPPSGNLVMAQGCDYDYKDYVFDFSNSGESKAYSFIFAVGCSYGISCTKKSDRFRPEYRVPQFNKKAASEIKVEVVSNNLIGALPNTTADIEIRVVDVSHKVLAAVALDKMRFESSVQTVYVDVPTINGSLITIPGFPAGGGTGHSPSEPLIYHAGIKNNASGHQGRHWGLVKVLDTYPTKRNSIPELADKDGIKRVAPGTDPLEGLFSIKEFATYQVFPIDILSECGPITGAIISPTCPVTGIGNGQKLDFIVQAQTANGGEKIILYEVDYNYDGIKFRSDAYSTSGIFDDVGPFTVPSPCEDNIPYSYTVAFRAKDQCVPPNETIFATCNVIVDKCVAPVGNLILKVNRRNNVDHGIDATRPWTLMWEAAAGAQEYAIYYDNDPTDGIDNNFQLVGTVPASTSNLEYDVPPQHFTNYNGWVRGHTYTVRNRTIAGDPMSELANSEYAFVMTSCFDNLAMSQSFGYPGGSGNTEGWKVALERTPYASDPFIRYWPYVTTTLRTSDPASLSALIYYLGAPWTYGTGGASDNYPGHLVAETIETPSIPQSSVRIFEFVASSTNGWDCDEEGGVIIGYSDSPVQPGAGWDGKDFHWVMAYPTSQGYLGYNYLHNNPEYPFPFNMSAWPPGVNNCWKWRSG